MCFSQSRPSEAERLKRSQANGTIYCGIKEDRGCQWYNAFNSPLHNCSLEMSALAPNPKLQRAAREKLKVLFQEPSTVSAIHYSCESFQDRKEGKSPRITSIAIAELASQQAVSFSIHKLAERRQLPFLSIEDHYDELELQMLQEFYSYLRQHQQSKFLHWNMRDDNYGFQAIEHRYRVLTDDEEPIHRVPEGQRFDLAILFKDIYGPTYAPDPRMQRLLEINSAVPRGFLPGQDEAVAFEKKEYHRLHQSSLAKVHAITTVAQLAYNGQLKTGTGMWQMPGGGIKAPVAFLFEHPVAVGLTTFIGAIAGVGGFFLG